MPDLKTPDPSSTIEVIGGGVLTIVTDVVILFNLHLTDAQRAALGSLVTTVFVLAALAYAAYVRGHRAIAVGLSTPSAEVHVTAPTPTAATPLPSAPTTTASGASLAPRVRPSRAKPKPPPAA